MKNQGQSYDKIADGFADMRIEFASEKPHIDEFISYLNSNDRILDVGCGTGTPIAAYLMENGFQVTGIDGSIAMLNIAKKRHPNMKIKQGDVRVFEPEIKYNGIIEWWCLFHIPVEDQLSMIKKFYHWLYPNGILQFTSGKTAYQGTSSDMLNEPLDYYSGDKSQYLEVIHNLKFEILSCKSDQENHLVWTLKK